jgi:hypothetical protein
MTAWTADELSRMGRAEEIDIAVRRPDGRLRNRVTIWAVPYGDTLYVRSAVKGRDAAWFRAVQETHEGRVWAGGIEKDVTFEDANRDLDDEIDTAFRTKYRRYAGRILNTVLTPEARSTTIKLATRSSS